MKKGITLIALVITVIIILIVAGISIIMLLGENGIIERSKITKQENVIAQYKEKIELVKAEIGVKNEGNITLDNLNNAFNETSQKDWINKTELKDGIIRLTTKDGYLFFVTESITEYKGYEDVIIPEVIMAEMLEYTPDSNLNWSGVTNVKQALDYLYNNEVCEEI